MLKHLHTFAVISILLASFMLFAACSSAPTIDGTSDETMQASIEKIAKTLNKEEGKNFAAALMIVGMKEAMSGADPAAIRKKLDGKNAEEVAVMAREISKE